MSIKNKLVIIIISASAFTIILGLFVFSIFDIINYKTEMKKNASLNANLVGQYCSAALLFAYQDEANQLLKGLNSMPDIVNACIYDKDNKIFAYYDKSPDDKISFQRPTGDKTELSGNYLHVIKPIIYQNEVIGKIYLRVSAVHLTEKIITNIIVFILLLLGLSGPVFIVASKLQRLVSEPIMKLAEITDRIAQSKDYSIKVDTDRKDVIGNLYNRFNDMLIQINKRQREIEAARDELKKLNDELEDRVTHRTFDLQKTNEELSSAKKAIEDANLELIQEIEMRKHIEAALERSIKAEETIIDSIPIPTAITKIEDGTIIRANQAMAEFHKMTSEEIKKTKAVDWYVNLDERLHLMNELKSSGYIINHEIRHKRIGTGEVREVIISYYFVNYEETACVVGSFLDITDMKKNQNELTKAKEQAESADRLKSAFLATMSHELRTPLNSIIGFTGILLKGLTGPLNEEQSKQLTMIKGSGQHLLELINDVLDISKIEAGELVVSLKSFDLNSSIRKVISTVLPLADKKGLELRKNISPDINNIISDERRIEQIFLNILNNAIKFTEQGYVEINCAVQNGEIITEITDTGIGIKKEDIEKLFKPFSQLDTGITRNYEGTGLGLSICTKLLEKLKGQISVESKFNIGSTFRITLPINGESIDEPKNIDNRR
jgi:PAS domain S-box-containing protein